MNRQKWSMRRLLSNERSDLFLLFLMALSVFSVVTDGINLDDDGIVDGNDSDLPNPFDVPAAADPVIIQAVFIHQSPESLPHAVSIGSFTVSRAPPA